MGRKIYHKFEIVEQWPDEGGHIVGVDPIFLEGAFGLSDEIYSLLCTLSTCVVCGKPAEALEQHLACVRDLEPITEYRRGVTVTRTQGRLGFFIPNEAYWGQFRSVYSDGWQHRQRSARAYRRAMNGGAHTVKDVCALLKYQQKRCYYCFVSFDGNDEGGYHFHREHMQPLARGGADDLENTVLTCALCNIEKGQEDWDSFLSRRMQRLSVGDRAALLAMHAQAADWKRQLAAQTPDGLAPEQSPVTMPSESRLKLTPAFVPSELFGDSLQYRIGPKRWCSLKTAVIRAAAGRCSICRDPANEEDPDGLLAFEEWVYAHAVRPAAARLQSIRAVCPKCYSVLHFDELRQRVTMGDCRESRLNEAIAQFCRVNTADASVLDRLYQRGMDIRSKNVCVFYELEWGRFEPLLGKRVRHDHEFLLGARKRERAGSHDGLGHLIGKVPMPIPDGRSIVHVVPLFDATTVSGIRTTTKISEMLSIDGELGYHGSQSAQAWRGVSYGEYREAAEYELAKAIDRN